MALKTFEYNFIAFLHAPVMDQDGIDKLIVNREWVVNAMHADRRFEDDEDWEYLLSKITLEKVREESIQFVLNVFYYMGMDEPGNCCLDVILNGWQAFSYPDLLFWYITGSD